MVFSEILMTVRYDFSAQLSLTVTHSFLHKSDFFEPVCPELKAVMK